MPAHEEIAKVAYALWQERGCPLGSPEVDWARAEAELSDTQYAAEGERAENTGP